MRCSTTRLTSDKTKRAKARQNAMRRSEAKQNETRLDEATQSTTRQNKIRHGERKQDKTRQGESRRSATRPSERRLGKTKATRLGETSHERQDKTKQSEKHTVTVAPPFSGASLRSRFRPRFALCVYEAALRKARRVGERLDTRPRKHSYQMQMSRARQAALKTHERRLREAPRARTTGLLAHP